MNGIKMYSMSALIGLMFLVIPLVAFKTSTEKQTEYVTTQTISYVNNDMSSIKAFIDKCVSEGYAVKHIISQSVGVSVTSTNSTYLKREAKGDIIVVLEKQIITPISKPNTKK